MTIGTWKVKAHTRRGPLALVCGALLLGAALAGCAPNSGVGGSVLAASVNGHGITLSDYQGLLTVYQASSEYSAASQGQPTTFAWQDPNGRTQVASATQGTMDFLIGYELMREQLKQPVSAKSVQSDYDSLEKERAQLLKASDPTATAFAQALTPKMVRLLAEQSAVSSAAMADAVVPTAHLRIILVKSQAEAQSLQQQAEHGKDFGQLAHANNTDTGLAASNGDLPQSTYYVGELAGGTSAQADIDQAIAGKGAYKGKYAIISVQGQWALIEITQRANKKLSDLNDPNTEQTVYQAWLTDIVRPASHVDVFVSLS